MEKNLFKLILFVIISMWNISLSAQTIHVKGNVSDASGPLIGVAVQDEDGKIGTVTDPQGNYSLSVAKGKTLTYSYVGYNTIQRKVNGSVINVTMTETTSQLDELVVVGYGTMKKSDVATSVATVNTSEMKATPSGNVGDMLRGRVAGVNVVSTSGRPGSAPGITIRGSRSISASNSPLYIIDGAVSDATEFATLSADNVESIEVLRDAASQAIYGARASDGVILVTTKSGVTGKPQIDYNGYVGVQSLTRNFDFYSPEEYLLLRREAKAHDKGLVDAREMTIEEALGDEMMQQVWASGSSIDWEKAMLHDAWYQNHDLNIRGGSDKLTASLGANFFDQDGIVRIGSHFRRGTVRMKVDYDVTKWAKVGINTNFAWMKRKIEDGNFNEFITRPPLGMLYNEDGTYTKYMDSNNDVNPLYRAQHAKHEVTAHNYRVNAYIELKPIKNLAYKMNVSTYTRNQEEGSSKDRYYPGGGSTASLTNSEVNSLLLENILTYKVPFTNKNHDLIITAVQSYDHRKSSSLGYSCDNLPVDKDWNFIANGEISSAPTRTYSENNLISYLARVSYSFMQRYIINTSIRCDGSSRFGKNNKWGTFPSVALAWRVNQESFMKNQNWIDNLKLRLSYGIVGNQNGIGNYTTLGLTNRHRYEFGDNLEMGYLPTSELTNTNLKWEQSATWNLGVDYGFLGNRLYGSVDVYKTRTTNLLVYRGINSALGYTSMLDNLGETKTSGLDLSLTGELIHSNKFFWSMGTNFSVYHDEIVKIDDQIDVDGNPSSQPGNSWFIGKPIHVYYDYKIDGVYQYSDFDISVDSKGDPVYKLKPTIDTDGDDVADAALKRIDAVGPGSMNVRDMNGDGVIDGNDRTQFKKDPDFTISLNTTVKWNNFDFYMDWYAVSGLYKQNIYLYSSNAGGSLSGKLNGVKVNYWTPFNPSNDFPRPSHNSLTPFQSSKSIQDASYIRLRTIQIGYSVPRKLIRRLSLTRLRCYATATNLLTFSKYLSYSPELSPSAYPESRQFVFGINLSF